MKLKRTNKLLALLLTLVMLVGLLPTMALADDTYSFKVSSSETGADASFDYDYCDDDDGDIEYDDSDVASADISIDKSAIDRGHSTCPFIVYVLLKDYDKDNYTFDHWTINGVAADSASVTGADIIPRVNGFGQNSINVEFENGSDLTDLEIVAVFTANTVSSTCSFKVSSSETGADASFDYDYCDDDDGDIEYDDSDVASADISIDKSAIDSGHGTCPFIVYVLLKDYDKDNYTFDHWTINGVAADSASVTGADIIPRVNGFGQNSINVEFENGSDLTDLEIVAVFTAKGSGSPSYTVTASVNDSTMGSATATQNGTSYVLSATANSNYAFDHWEKDGASVSTANPFTVTPTENATYTAVFVSVTPTPKKEDGAECISYQKMDISVQDNYEKNTPYIGGRAALVLPFSMNTQISKETAIHAVVKSGTAVVANRTCTVASLVRDSILYLIVPFDPLTADMTSLTATVTVSEGETSFGTLEYTVPVTAAASAENSDFRYLTSPESNNNYAFIVDKGPTFRGFYAEVDESTGALTLYGYAKGYSDVDEGVFVFSGSGATDFVKVENPSEEILSHAPDGTAPADIEGAPATTGLQSVIRVVQDHNGDWYALTKGRLHKSSDSFGNEPYVGSDIYKWDKTNEKWVYQIMSDFNDPDDKLDESQIRIRPDGVNRMDVVTDGVTVLYGDAPTGYDGYSGCGSVYLFTADRIISFVSNGGSAVQPLTAPMLSAITPPTSPTREGYTFVGWYTMENFMNNGSSYAFSVMPAANLTLYAKWMEKSSGTGGQTDPFAGEKEKAQASLDTALARLDAGDYDSSVWTSIQSAYNSGKSAIAAADSYDGVYAALNEAVDEINALAQQISGTMSVTVTVEKFTVDGKYIIEPTTVTVERNALASVVLTDLLKEHYDGVYSGRPYTMTGTETQNFYLSGVYDSDISGFLFEKDHGDSSGWVYCVNGSFPGVGASSTAPTIPGQIYNFKGVITMKNQNGIMVIGVDHGYGNIKTANCCFPTGIMGYDSEPLFTGDMLTYEGRYYLIGEGHKEFLAEKTMDDDYYLLTLAAIARELAMAELTEASVYLAVGLPLTWTASQKAEFAAYLSRNEEACFTYKKVDYRIRIVGVKVYPQGYAAVAQLKGQMKGVCLVADIGNGTMNVLYIVNGRPQTTRMYTEKFGTYQCTLAAREDFMRRTRRELNDAIIDEVHRTGTADIREEDLSIIRASATEYVDGIFRRLREHGYDENTMTLYITGGGGCLVRNFGQFNKDRVRFVDDICAAAKGFEFLASVQLAHDV